jgi:hypothetical protein
LGDARQLLKWQSLFQDERGCQVQRSSAAHRQIVYRAVYRQPPDVAPRKKQGRDDKGIGRKSDAGRADVEHRLIIEFAQRGIIESRQEELANQLRGQPPSTAMAEHDGLMLADRQRTRKRECCFH